MANEDMFVVLLHIKRIPGCIGCALYIFFKCDQMSERPTDRPTEASE